MPYGWQAAGQVLQPRSPFVREVNVAEFQVDAVIATRLQLLRHFAGCQHRRHQQGVGLGSGDDQGRVGFIDQHAVCLVDDRRMQSTRAHLASLGLQLADASAHRIDRAFEHDLVHQVISQKLLARAVDDIRAVSQA